MARKNTDNKVLPEGWIVTIELNDSSLPVMQIWGPRNTDQKWMELDDAECLANSILESVAFARGEHS